MLTCIKSCLFYFHLNTSCAQLKTEIATQGRTRRRHRLPRGVTVDSLVWCAKDQCPLSQSPVRSVGRPVGHAISAPSSRKITRCRRRFIGGDNDGTSQPPPQAINRPVVEPSLTLPSNIRRGAACGHRKQE